MPFWGWITVFEPVFRRQKEHGSSHPATRPFILCRLTSLTRCNLACKESVVGESGLRSDVRTQRNHGLMRTPAAVSRVNKNNPALDSQCSSSVPSCEEHFPDISNRFFDCF